MDRWLCGCGCGTALVLLADGFPRFGYVDQEHRRRAIAADERRYLEAQAAGFPCRCGATWTGRSRCHCGGCHRTFSSLSSFEHHRVALACAEPLSRGMVDRDGIWGLPGGWDASQLRTRSKARQGDTDA